MKITPTPGWLSLFLITNRITVFLRNLRDTFTGFILQTQLTVIYMNRYFILLLIAVQGYTIIVDAKDIGYRILLLRLRTLKVPKLC